MGRWHGVELSDLTIRGERLTLRPFLPSDVESVHAAMQDPSMHEFLPIPDPYTRADATTWVLQDGHRGRMDGAGLAAAVVETDTRRLLGAVSLRLPGDGRVAAEIGYSIYPGARGHGYAAEASRILAGWAFEHDVPRVQIRCAVANLASVRTALAAGFCFEGVARADVLTADGPADGAVFGRCPHDPPEPVTPAFAALPSGGLSDGIVTMHPATPDDDDVLLAEFNNPEARRWALRTDPLTAREACERAERAGLHWLVGPHALMIIVDAASDRPAGTVGMHLNALPGVVDVGYGVLPEWRGRGYTGRCLRLLRDWAFTVGGFNRLQLGTDLANLASQGAARSGGFVREGVQKAVLRSADGSLADEVVFAALRPATTRRLRIRATSSSG